MIPRRTRLRRTLVVATAVAAVTTGAWMAHDGSMSAGPSAPAPGGSAAHPSPGAGAGDAPAPPLPRAVPLRLTVPTLRLSAPLVPVGLDTARHLQPPPLDRPREAGWYAAGPTPGSAGTALVVGHVDDRTGPAVFFLLAKLRPGDPIDVTRADGRTAHFTVDAVALYPKKHFPSRQVYGTRPGPPQLRLLTCGGRYSARTGYVANTVVYAHLTLTGRATRATSEQSPHGSLPRRH